MAVPFSNTKLRVPRGFQNLLEGLAREVLRNQPDNIYAFAAIYFDNLLKMREQQGIDPAEIGARHEDRYYNNKAFQNGNVGDVSDPQQQEAAVKIQSAVRGHQSRESSRPDPEATKPSQEEAAVTIQAAYRGEGEAEPATEGGTQEPAAAPEQEEEVDIDLDDPEVEKAAIKIQSSFKGFKTRKEMSAKKSDSSPTAEGTEPAEPSQQEAADDAEPPKPAEETSQAEQPPADASTTEAPGEAPGEAPAEEEEEEVDIDLEDPEVEKAAIKIQAGFKGMMVRKGKKEGTKEEETPAEEAAPAAEGDAKAEEPPAEATGDAEAPAPEETKKEEEEEVDIDLSDPQVQDAAVKIQAGFKGMMVRKQMKDGKSEAGSEGAPADGDAPREEAAEPAATEDAPQEGETAPAAEGEAPAEAGAGQAEEAPKAEGDAPEAEATQQEEAATQGEAAPAEGEAPADDAPQAEQEAPKEEEAAPTEGETAPAEETEQAEAPAEPTSTTSTEDKDRTPPSSQFTSQGDNTTAVENVVERGIEIEADNVKGNREESKDGEIHAEDATQEVQSANQIAVTDGLDGEQGGEGTSPEAGNEDQAAKDQNARSSKQSVVEEPDSRQTTDVAEGAKAEESIETENVDDVDQAAKDESARSSKQSVAAEPVAKESGEMEETAQAEKDIEIAGKMDEEQDGQAGIEKEAENVTEVDTEKQLKDGQEVDGNAVMPDSGNQGQADNKDQVISEAAAAEVQMASEDEQDVAQDKQTAVSDITHGLDESNTVEVPSEDKEENGETVPRQEESDPTGDKNEESKENTKMEEQIDSAVITDEAKQAEESSADKEGGIGDTDVAVVEETATAEEVLATNEVQDVEQEGVVPDETQSQISEVQEASESDLEAKEEVTIKIEESQDEVLSGDVKKNMVDDNEGRDSGLGFEVDSLPESTVQASQEGQTDQDDKPETPDDLGSKEEQGTILQGDQSGNVGENQPNDKPSQDANEHSQDATVEKAQNANDVEGQELEDQEAKAVEEAPNANDVEEQDLEAQEAKEEGEASEPAEPSAEEPSGQGVDDQGQEISNVHGTQDDQSRGEEIASSEDHRDGGGEQEGVGEQEGKELA